MSDSPPEMAVHLSHQEASDASVISDLVAFASDSAEFCETAIYEAITDGHTQVVKALLPVYERVCLQGKEDALFPLLRMALQMRSQQRVVKAIYDHAELSPRRVTDLLEENAGDPIRVRRLLTKPCEPITDDLRLCRCIGKAVAGSDWDGRESLVDRFLGAILGDRSLGDLDEKAMAGLRAACLSAQSSTFIRCMEPRGFRFPVGSISLDSCYGSSRTTNPSLAQFLLERGAFDLSDPAGLLLASQSIHALPVLNALLARGHSPNYCGRGGVTSLHRASSSQDKVALVFALLEAGADPYAPDDFGETPVQVAAERACDHHAPETNPLMAAYAVYGVDVEAEIALARTRLAQIRLDPDLERPALMDFASVREAYMTLIRGDGSQLLALEFQDLAFSLHTYAEAGISLAAKWFTEVNRLSEERRRAGFAEQEPPTPSVKRTDSR